METEKKIFAKGERNGSTLLIDHLKHVAIVAKKIALNIGIDEKVAISGAYLHDLGKAHPEFQKILNGEYDRNKISFRHEIASLFFLPLFPRNQWGELTDMVIAHHRSPVNDSRMQGIVDLVNFEGADEVFNRHIEQWDIWAKRAIKILSSLGITTKVISKEEARFAFDFTIDHCEGKQLGWSKLKGLINSADYFASALDGQTDSIAVDLFTKPDTVFYHSDGRKSALFPLSQIPTDDIRKHTILSAPTGAGKTDFLIRRCQNRFFYVLPFQASINAMYHRFKSEFPAETDIRLLHAASSIVLHEQSYEEKILPPLVGASVKVLTPHQLAALICGTKGFESIAIDIGGSDVILDEIHSYSNIAQSMVIEIIKVLLRLNCNIHIGTATMPSSLKKHLLNLLGGDSEVYEVELNKEKLTSFNRHRIYKCDSFDVVKRIISRALSRNEKILVVCNRVDEAQRRFTEFKTEYPDYPILLLHSRFRRVDRNSLETKLMNEFNNREIMHDACIVVATQVVEVSLDIDFDLMVTDAAPIDSLIQRFGRINRKRTAEKLKEQVIKNIYVVAPPDSVRDCLPYKKEIVDNSFDLLPNGKILYEDEIQRIIDLVYPDIELLPIDVHLAWKGDQFLIKELCHYPKANLLELLNIDSTACIKFSDKEEYESGNLNRRLSLEIPVNRSIMFRNITTYGRANCGNKPLIIDDELYDENIGLQWKQIDTII